MKKTILFAFASLVINFKSAVSQELDMTWSEKTVSENKLDGFFESYVGSNSKYVYAKFTESSRKISGRKYKLIAYDKKTMERVFDSELNDPRAKEDEFKRIYYSQTVVFEKLIYVFWRRESKEVDELFVQTFDSQLNPVKELQKVYELHSAKGDKKKAELFVMANKNINEKILIGGELSSNEDTEVKIEYKLLNSDFSFAASNQVTLPIKITGKSDMLTSIYELGNDGNLQVKTRINMTKEERKALKKGESNSYFVLSIVDLASGNIKTYPIKFENKNIFDFNTIVKEKSIRLFGLFCDLAKDSRGNDIHGIFSSTIDSKTFQLVDNNFTYFTKQQLDKLFARDKEDRSDKARSKKKKKSEDESIASNYVIENVQMVDNDNLVFFCSRMKNYSVTTCDTKGNCTTRYYCEKSNVTAIKINKKGEILWGSNLDRKITYDNWDVYDIKVVAKKDKFYVIYGSAFMMNAQKKNRKSRKRSEMMTDRLEYAVFDVNTGEYDKKEYKVNNLGVKKKDKKYLYAAYNIEAMDDQFYVCSSKLRINPFTVCCYAPIFFPNTLKADTYMGAIVPIQ